MKEIKKSILLDRFGERMMGGTEELPDLTQRAQEQTGGQEKEASVAGERSTNEAREKEFRNLMEGEYKDLFTSYFQETFNRRFKQQKGMKEELSRARDVVNAAAERFGIRDEAELAAAIRAEQNEMASADHGAAGDAHVPTAKEGEIEEMVKRAVADAVAVAREETERAVLERIRARGMRPTENALIPGVGRQGQGGAARLSRAERAEMARRAARGEHIEF